MSGLDRTAYWKAFREIVSADIFALPPVGETHGRGLYQHFDKGESGFELCATLNEQDRYICVELIYRFPKNRQEILANTHNVRFPIGNVDGLVNLEWNDERNVKQIKGQEKANVSGFTADNWRAQHLWLAVKLVAINSTMSKSLNDLERENR